LEKACTRFVSSLLRIHRLIYDYSSFLLESSSVPATKDDKQPTSTSNNNSQNSQETNVNNGKNIDSNKVRERQPSQTASSSNSYTALHTQDEVR